MKIAYIILAHKYPEQLVRLITRLSNESVYFFIHVDRNLSEVMYQRIVGILSHLPNIYFLNRHKCSWGDFSLVTAALEGIKAVFTRKDIVFDWVMLLSGQDYPIKSNSQIVEFLLNNQGKSFIEYFPLPKPAHLTPVWSNGGLDRINYWHFRLFNQPFVFPGRREIGIYHLKRYQGRPTIKARILSKLWSALVAWIPIKRKFPLGFKPFAGSQFWILSNDCAQYVHDFIQHHPTVVNYFKYVDIPDEMFFQSILLNSKFRHSVVNESLWHVDWDNPNPEYPATMEAKDFETLAKSSKLFARKFDMWRDTEILDMLDRRILNAKTEQIK